MIWGENSIFGNTYCWWTKSYTTKDDDDPIICRVLTIPGGAGFRPSKVYQWFEVCLLFLDGAVTFALLRSGEVRCHRSSTGGGVMSRSRPGGIFCSVSTLNKQLLFGGFQIFFIFIPSWGRFPFWLIFLKWVETTNQLLFVQRKRVKHAQYATRENCF